MATEIIYEIGYDTYGLEVEVMQRLIAALPGNYKIIEEEDDFGHYHFVVTGDYYYKDNWFTWTRKIISGHRVFTVGVLGGHGSQPSVNVEIYRPDEVDKAIEGAFPEIVEDLEKRFNVTFKSRITYSPDR